MVRAAGGLPQLVAALPLLQAEDHQNPVAAVRQSRAEDHQNRDVLRVHRGRPSACALDALGAVRPDIVRALPYRGAAGIHPGFPGEDDRRLACHAGYPRRMCRWGPVSAAALEPCRRVSGRSAASPCGAQAALEGPVAVALALRPQRESEPGFRQRRVQTVAQALALQQSVLPAQLQRVPQQQPQPEEPEPMVLPAPEQRVQRPEAPRQEPSPPAFPRREAVLPWRAPLAA